jgi:hypothetical protein
VITVFLSQPSAFARGASIPPMSAIQHTVIATLRIFIPCFFFLLNFVWFSRHI